MVKVISLINSKGRLFFVRRSELVVLGYLPNIT